MKNIAKPAPEITPEDIEFKWEESKAKTLQALEPLLDRVRYSGNGRFSVTSDVYKGNGTFMLVVRYDKHWPKDLVNGEFLLRAKEDNTFLCKISTGTWGASSIFKEKGLETLEDVYALLEQWLGVMDPSILKASPEILALLKEAEQVSKAAQIALRKDGSAELAEFTLEDPAQAAEISSTAQALLDQAEQVAMTAQETTSSSPASLSEMFNGQSLKGLHVQFVTENPYVAEEYGDKVDIHDVLTITYETGNHQYVTVEDKAGRAATVPTYLLKPAPLAP